MAKNGENLIGIDLSKEEFEKYFERRAEEYAKGGFVYNMLSVCEDLERKPTHQEWGWVLEKYISEGKFFTFLEVLTLRGIPLTPKEIVKYRNLYKEIHLPHLID
jgi:hypothetical protein